jgi:hypothetical protein
MTAGMTRGSWSLEQLADKIAIRKAVTFGYNRARPHEDARKVRCVEIEAVRLPRMTTRRWMVLVAIAAVAFSPSLHGSRSDAGMWIAVSPQQSQFRPPRLTFQVM